MVVLVDLTDGGDGEWRSELTVDKRLLEVTGAIRQLVNVKTEETPKV